MKLIENKKLFGKFNIVDILIVLVVICAGIFIVMRFVVPQKTDGVSESKTISMVFLAEEVPEYAANAVKVGDTVSDDTKNCNLGTITEVIIDDSIAYGVNDKGEFIKGSKDGYKSVRIVTELTGELYPNGVIVGVTKYGIGHSLTLSAGMTRIFGRVYDIQGEK